MFKMRRQADGWTIDAVSTFQASVITVDRLRGERVSGS
jgi:hypothetical protein